MMICDYRDINHIDDNDDWNYLDLEYAWSFTPFEQALELTYSKGNGGSDFLQNDEELVEWYDVNLIM